MKEIAKLQLVSQREKGPFVSIRYYVQWEYPDGTVRVPEESEMKFACPGSFTAAGKAYSSWQELCAVREDEYGQICRDIYGREVFAEWERFPCFDSYDYLYENRYYRWFYIREGDKLTCVYYKDEQKTIHVTEDVRRMRDRCWKAMQKANWQGASIIEKEPE